MLSSAHERAATAAALERGTSPDHQRHGSPHRSAVHAARASGSPFLDKVEYLLGSLRAAHGNATDPVVWPGCYRSAPPPVPAFEDFTSKKKAPVKSGGRGGSGGDSGDTDISHLRGSTSSHCGRAQASLSASSSSERADKTGVKKKSRTSRPSSDTAGGASSDSGSERSLLRKTSSGRVSRQQVKRRLDDGATGPEAFTLLLRLLLEQFDVGDRQESFLRLQQFGVSNGTLFVYFKYYLWAFRLWFLR
ncbi:unnamed protein product [Ectocarpus sp. CCAP 1310/34]|nr:unnamed protein product [Ectocarpus sp. CCAP 1310/34]